ncbi:AzlC family ABC transporter permease [Pelosinus sp. sgz500959]|uniref:AzlC family ABC transporter permease n=1 Tax=Pelosinus sp. sgz500959 TaxID=3242472 RepID=UPI00366DC56E
MEEIQKDFYCNPGKSEFWIGVRDSLPLIIGVIPFGITCGIMALAAGLTSGETLLMSMFVFAGAAQFIAITMLGAGVSGWGLIVFTTLLINLRHLLMGASLAPYMIRLPIFLQALLSFGLVDETYAIVIDRIQKKGYNVNYQMGANVAFYSFWIVSTAMGVVLSDYISDPLAWGLDFAMPAIFLAMLIPRLVNSTALVVCGVAAVVSVICALYLPGKWYIIVTCLAAILVGGIMEERSTYAQ